MTQQWRQKGKRKKAFWKDRPGFCQTCGHREWNHKEYVFGLMCLGGQKGGCNCEEYNAVPEHDFSKDEEYDKVAYGEYEKPKAEVTQRTFDV